MNYEEKTTAKIRDALKTLLTNNVDFCYGVVFHGKSSDLIKLKEKILEVLGATANDGYIHPANLKMGLRLVYQTISSSPLLIIQRHCEGATSYRGGSEGSDREA